MWRESSNFAHCLNVPKQDNGNKNYLLPEFLSIK